MILKKVRNEDKQYLSPEAVRGSTMVLPSGRVYLCRESANDFMFAGWEQVIFWRHPIAYLTILNNTRKAFK